MSSFINLSNDTKLEDVKLPDRFCYLDVFPACESRYIEFKEYFNPEKMSRKYYETACAFLNSSGGHLLFGIRDRDRVIQGVRMNQQHIDAFLLFVDRLSSVITYQPESRQQKITANPLDDQSVYVPPSVFKSRVEQISKNYYVCVISFAPEENKKYCLTDKSIYIRVQAGNYKVKPAQVIYNQNEVDRILHNKIQEVQNEYDKRMKEIVIQVSNSLYDLYNPRLIGTSCDTPQNETNIEHMIPLFVMFVVISSLLYVANF